MRYTVDIYGENSFIERDVESLQEVFQIIEDFIDQSNIQVINLTKFRCL